MNIEPLSFEKHLSIQQNLSLFWGKNEKELLPYHHYVFPALFSDLSFILLDKGNIYSYLYALSNQQEAFIHLLATQKGFYRQGYAAKLILHLEQVCKMKSVFRIQTYCLEENPLGSLFFNKMSYQKANLMEIRPGKFARIFTKNLA